MSVQIGWLDLRLSLDRSGASLRSPLRTGSGPLLKGLGANAQTVHDDFVVRK